MSWNIFDQSNQVTYNNGKSNFWQCPPTPTLLNLNQPIVDCARETLGRINEFTVRDYLACVYADKTHCHLIRVHNGGFDNKGRPQRWVLLVWSEPLTEHFSLDLDAWLNDTSWPAREPVPLPMPIPTQPYVFPVSKSGLPLSERSIEWAEWLANPNRKETGWLLLGLFRGNELFYKSLEKKRVENDLTPPAKNNTGPEAENDPNPSVIDKVRRFWQRLRKHYLWALVLLLILLLILGAYSWYSCPILSENPAVPVNIPNAEGRNAPASDGASQPRKAPPASGAKLQTSQDAAEHPDLDKESKPAPTNVPNKDGIDRSRGHPNNR